MADGTYTSTARLRNQPVGDWGAGVVIEGNVNSPASCVISVVGSFAFWPQNCGKIYIRGFRLLASGTTGLFLAQGVAIQAEFSALVYFRNIDFGACGHAHIVSAAHSYVTLESSSPNSVPYSITGGAVYHAVAADQAMISLSGGLITLSGTPAFTTAFAYTTQGQVACQGTTFSGSATAPYKALAANLGLITTNGADTSYFPGGGAATTTNGGIYI